MLIAVMSDLHDNVTAWKIINLKIEQAGIKHLINCGDTCAIAMLHEMSDTFSGQIYTVIGNVGDRHPDMKLIKSMDNVTWFNDRGVIELDHRKIAFAHRPREAQPLIVSGKYNLVCHGHTHLKRYEKIGRTVVVNPGTAGGMFQYPSYATIDLAKMTVEFKEVIMPLGSRP